MSRYLPLLQASKLDLAAACLYPWTSGIRWDSGTSSDAGQYGNALHEWAAGLVRGVAPSIAVVAEKYGVTAPSQLRRLEGACHDARNHVASLEVDRIEAEIPIAFWPLTCEARRLEPGEERPPGAMLFYIDVLHEAQGFVTVLDWKTGRRPILRRVEDTPQVRVYGLAICKALGLDEVRVELGWLSDRGLWIDPAYFDAFDLAVIEHEVRSLEEARQRGGAVPQYGLHCVEGWCPIIGRCPAAQAAAAEVEMATAGCYDLAPPTSDEHARDLFERLPLARAYLDELEKALEEWASRSPIDFGDGTVWGRVEKQGNESVAVTPEALEVLQTHLESFFDVAVRTEVSTSKTDIARAVKSLVAERQEKRGAQKRRLDPLLEELRAVGAVKRGASYTKFERFKRATQAEDAAE